MKLPVKYFAAAIILITFLSSFTILPARSKTAEVTILTSAVCDKCKARIEKALKATEGIVSANLNVDTKKIKVKYDPDKTSPDKIRTIISNTGYDADNVKASTTAYNGLPHCCQKDAPKH